MLYRYLLPIAVALVASTVPVLSQALPCPPHPELAFVVDTPEKCNCFYALAGAGFDAGDTSTFDTVLNDNSVQTFAQTGQWVGVNGIAEYLSVAKGGMFIDDYISVGQELLLDMTGTTNEQCVATTAAKRRMPFNPIFTKDNAEVCVELVAGAVLYYTMTGNPAAPITIQKINVWLPDEVVSDTYPIFDTPNTAEVMCDAIVNTCGYNESNRRLKMKAQNKNNAAKTTKTGTSTKVTKKEKSTKATKKEKSTNVKHPKQSNAIKECLKKYQSLPTNEKIGNLTYIDGNTKGCRLLHAQLAISNPDHCPHISFAADEDINGLVKCNESKAAPLTDYFTDQQLVLFNYASILLDLGPTGIDIKYEACPAEL